MEEADAGGSAPGWARPSVGVIAGVLFLSSAGEAVVSVARAPANWSTFGFAVVTVLASVFGLLFAAGKLRGSPATTLGCIAGAVLVCSELCALGMDRWIVAALTKGSWLMGRRAIALVLLAITVAVALGGSRSGWRSMVSGAAGAVPLAAVGLWYKKAGLSPLLTPANGLGEALRLAGLVAVAGVALASLCAMVHYGIRAFELAGEARGDGADGRA